MVGGTRNQVSKDGVAVPFFFAVVVEFRHAVAGRQKEPRVDEAGSAKALFKKASLDVDPRDEGEILNPINGDAANDLKLRPAANTIRLLVALKLLQLKSEIGPFWRR